MLRIFITGSADGLGLLAAKALIQEGHQVVLHARNEQRKIDAHAQVPEAETILVADLQDIRQIKELAQDVNALGSFDVIIHNAGVYQAPSNIIFAVNSLAPYLLTCLIQRPKRLIYLSSGMHLLGQPHLHPIDLEHNRISYSDSKLHLVMLAKAVARKWTDIYVNAVDPGWVPTRMGGKEAPDNLKQGFETQVWLAISNDKNAKVSGRYFYHKQEHTHNPVADDIMLQESFLQRCFDLTGVLFPI